jgi:hypothetical protein
MPSGVAADEPVKAPPYHPDLDGPIHTQRQIAIAGNLYLPNGKPNIVQVSRLLAAGVIKAKKRGSGRHSRYSTTKRQVIQDLTGVVIGCFALMISFSFFFF